MSKKDIINNAKKVDFFLNKYLKKEKNSFLIKPMKYGTLSGSLDPDVGDFVRKYIEKYKSKNKVTVLLASHNMNEVERLCDSVVMMKAGKIVDHGTCADLIEKHGRNNLEEAFLKIARSNNELV